MAGREAILGELGYGTDEIRQLRGLCRVMSGSSPGAAERIR
jgi:hypothetical protein